MNTARLGWTLVHFLWQGGLIAAVYGSARHFFRAANDRYLLACAALALMLCAPAATWRVLAPEDRAAVAADRTARVPQPMPVLLPATVQAEVPAVRDAPWLRWAVAFWMCGASLLSLRMMGAWATAARLRWRMVRPAPAEWDRKVEILRQQLGVLRSVGLAVSSIVQAPLVVGAWRPLILVPVGMLAGMPAAQVEALLVHELAHIRRHDYLVNLLQSMAEALLFYHPAVWWVSSHIRAERERCCDDAAVAISGDVLGYVNALAELADRGIVRVAAAANGAPLADRIARLLGETPPAKRMARGTLLGAVVLAATTYGLLAQTERRPSFQVASVKPNTTNPQHHIVRPQPGGRLFAENAPVQMLILNAYQVQAYQVIGGPGWLASDGYDIEAKPESEVAPAQTWLMLQSLLADRFKLAVHRETRELPVYSLAGAKGEFHPPAATGAGCADSQPGQPPTPGVFPCGRVGVNMAPSGLQVSGGKAPMAEFIRMLAMVMGRPIMDRTGFSGPLDVHLAFAPDESTQGLPGAGPGAFPPSDPNHPNIFAALEEQMGLKLTSAKGPVEVLVIDHVERPSAN